ncbi:MAG: glycosyltransferase [Chloroflexota bacterium]
MTRIAVIVPTHWSARMGGSQYQAMCLVDSLVAAGNSLVTFVARRIGHGYSPMGYTLRQVGSRSRWARYSFLPDTMSLWNALKQAEPQAIYQRVGCAYTGIAAAFARRYGCRMYWHVAAEDDVKPFHQQTLLGTSQYLDKKVLEYGIRTAPFIVAQTEDQNRLLQANYGRWADAIIPNFHPEPTEEISRDLPVQVVWIGNLKPVKQPMVFVQLAKDLATHLPTVRFTMVGAMSSDARWQAAFNREIASQPNLHYLGEVPQEQVNRILARSHLLVNTSISEGFSNTFVQAWLRAVPVVSLNSNPDSILTPGELGRHSRDYQTLKADVQELAEDHTRRQAMGQAAREYARRRHSMQNVQQLVSLLATT